VTIVLQESLRAVFYAPFYVALARDAYAKEGVDVRFASAPSPGRAALAVLDGSVDVCWGGPMRVMQAYAQAAYDQSAGCDLVHVAEVVTRDPFLLAGRAPRTDFTLQELADLRLGSVSEVPTPWMCLQEDLRRSGMQPDTLQRRTDGTMGDNVAAMLRGELDVVQVFEPFAAELEAQGHGYVWYAGADRGPTSYTTLYMRRALAAERRDDILRMVRAIYRVQKWLRQASGGEIAAAIGQYFPDVPAPILRASCARYKALSVWGADPRLPREGYDRLLRSLVSGGFVNPGTPFNIAVDNSFAEAVIREDPPPLG
jgi:NitT/TauT family transport system substrate-binding protein